MPQEFHADIKFYPRQCCGSRRGGIVSPGSSLSWGVLSYETLFLSSYTIKTLSFPILARLLAFFYFYSFLARTAFVFLALKDGLYTLLFTWLVF